MRNCVIHKPTISVRPQPALFCAGNSIGSLDYIQPSNSWGQTTQGGLTYSTCSSAYHTPARGRHCHTGASTHGRTQSPQANVAVVSKLRCEVCTYTRRFMDSLESCRAILRRLSNEHMVPRTICTTQVRTIGNSDQLVTIRTDGGDTQGRNWSQSVLPKTLARIWLGAMAQYSRNVWPFVKLNGIARLGTTLTSHSCVSSTLTDPL